MAVHQVPTGTYDTRAAFAVRGGSFRDRRHFAATAVLVRHPQGDLLVDAGFGGDVEAHIAALPRFVRSPHHVTATARDQLDAAGYDRSRLLGVLVTHSYWDHVSAGQGDLARALGLDKTTLMSQLDRLGARGLVVRRADPHDRRARRPAMTGAGDAVRARVARTCAEVEAATLARFAPGEVDLLRRMLFEITGDTQDRGSCL